LGVFHALGWVVLTSDVSFSLTKAGGSLGIVTGMIAYYIALAELLAAEQFKLFSLPLGVFNVD
jgi:succinate-acetate transporter protein